MSEISKGYILGIFIDENLNKVNETVVKLSMYRQKEMTTR